MSAMALFSIAMLRVSVTGTKRLCAVEQNNKRRKHVGMSLGSYSPQPPKEPFNYRSNSPSSHFLMKRSLVFREDW